MLFNIWAPRDFSKTTVIATDSEHALNIFCQRHGFADHAAYCVWHELAKTNLNIEAV